MRLARAGAANQDSMTLLRDDVALGQIPHQTLVDRRVLEREAFNILGQRQFADRQLLFDRACLLLRDLRPEQFSRKALRLVLAFGGRGEDLVIGILHAIQPQLAHHGEDFRSLLGHVLLS